MNDKEEKPVLANEQNSDANSAEPQGTSTDIKAQFSLKINAEPDSKENSIVKDNSLSSLDELAASLRERIKEDDLNRAVIITIENDKDRAPVAFECNYPEKESENNNIENSIQNEAPLAALTGENAGVFNIKSHIDIHRESPDDRSRTHSIKSITALLRKEKDRLEDEDSFITMDMCQKEKMTSTDIPTVQFSQDNRTQNIIVARSEYQNRPPPPPYEEYPNPQRQRQYQSESAPGYTRGEYVGTPRDASRTPPYRTTFADYMEDLSEAKEIRHNFIRKVYAILTVQLLFTFGMILLCIYEENCRKFVIKYWPVLIGATVVWFIVMMALFCYKQARRIFPLNFILLTLLTVTMAYITAAVSCMYQTKIVLVAMGVTAGVCFLVTLLACQHWFDITKWTFLIVIASIVFIIYGFITMIVWLITRSSVLYLVYSCIGALIFCVYLMYDTQQILGGRRIELSPEEYILGALTLYVDIMILFQHILSIAGYASR